MRQTAHGAAVLLFFCAGVLAAETTALFTVAQDHNQEYQRIHLDLELAGLRAERQQIQARTHLDQLQVFDTLLASRIVYRGGLESFLNAALATAYDVVRGQVALEIASLQEVRSTDQLRQVELRFQRGLAPQTEVLNAQIAHRAARRDREDARWTLEDAQILFLEAVGQEWAARYLPGFDVESSVPGGTLQQWMEANLELQRRETAAEIARLRYDRLPSNSPEFDRRIASAEVAQTEFAAAQARTAAERRFEQLSRRLDHLRETILIRRDEFSLRTELARETHRRFERGMATSPERDQAEIQRLQARAQLLDAEREFFSAATTWQLGLGIVPGGTLPW